MPVGTQAKLLRVLEDSRVRRLGGKNEIGVDVRVIAATNNRIIEEVGQQRVNLREDLYYRLNVFHIHLPPLRNIARTILPIAGAIADQDLNRKHDCRVTDFHPEVIETFRRHHWPGNVRELRNVLERAVILAGEGTIPPSHLIGDFGDGQKRSGVSRPRSRHRATARGHYRSRGREEADLADPRAHQQQQNPGSADSGNQPEDIAQ